MRLVIASWLLGLFISFAIDSYTIQSIVLNVLSVKYCNLRYVKAIYNELCLVG